MSEHLNQILLNLLQVITLLFPVVLLSMNYHLQYERKSASEDIDQKIAQLSIEMLPSLTITRAAETVGILILWIKEVLAFLAVLFLTLFWFAYEYFTYTLVGGLEDRVLFGKDFVGHSSARTSVEKRSGISA